VLQGRLESRENRLENFERHPEATSGILIKCNGTQSDYWGLNETTTNYGSRGFKVRPNQDSAILLNGSGRTESFLNNPAIDGISPQMNTILEGFVLAPTSSSSVLLNGNGLTNGFLEDPGISGLTEQPSLLSSFVRYLQKNAIFCDQKLWLRENGCAYYRPIGDLMDFCRFSVVCLMEKFNVEKDSAMEIGADFKMLKKIFSALLIDPDVQMRGILFNGKQNYLNLKNGVILVENGVISFLRMDKELCFKYQVNAHFNKRAEGTVFEKFLHGFIGDDPMAHRRFWQLMGHLLFENMTGKSLVWFYGKGNDGKSQFVKFLQKILQPKSALYCSDVGSAFDKHGLAYFTDAKLVVLQETNKTLTLSNVDVIKRLTGNDDVTVNPKNRPMYTKNFSLKILVLGNHLPMFAPGVVDDALKQRLQFVRVFSVPTEERVENISEILYGERDYFVTKAVEGFADLQASNFNFALCQKDEDLARTVLENDVASVFLEECCEIADGNYVFGERFKSFAEGWLHMGFYDWSVEDLRKALIAKGFVYTRFRAQGENRRGFRGFSLK